MTTTRRRSARTASVAACLMWATATVAQTPADPALIAAGKAVFETNCILCHRVDGNGRPPNFPALVGNERIADATLVIANVHEGQGFMPPFPSLKIEDIAAVASYVRNAWGNEFGGVTPLEVATLIAGMEPAGPVRTIWDGVYTPEQAARGKAVFNSPCGICHGSRLDGAADDMDMISGPPLARHKFLRNWDGRSLGALMSYAHRTMPQSNPGMLPVEDYVAIIAHMLSTSGAPPGEEPLSSDIRDLAHIVIAPKPGP